MSTDRRWEDELRSTFAENDRESLEFRIAQAKKIDACFDQYGAHGILLFGGIETAHAQHELKLAYINGLSISVVLLASALIERDLAGQLHIAGSEKAQRASFQWLIDRAFRIGAITAQEAKEFDQLRELRNSITHFTSPMDEHGSLKRAIKADVDIDEVFALDADRALDIVARYLTRRSIK